MYSWCSVSRLQPDSAWFIDSTWASFKIFVGYSFCPLLPGRGGWTLLTGALPCAVFLLSVPYKARTQAIIFVYCWLSRSLCFETRLHFFSTEPLSFFICWQFHTCDLMYLDLLHPSCLSQHFLHLLIRFFLLLHVVFCSFWLFCFWYPIFLRVLFLGRRTRQFSHLLSRSQWQTKVWFYQNYSWNTEFVTFTYRSWVRGCK